MKWVDVAGPPGVGKSTLCDPLWSPKDIPIEDIYPPEEWHDFCNEITRLLGVIREHPTFVSAVRMNRRSVRKMATVRAKSLSTTYVQTGFIQRGLGFGWRLADMGLPVDELYHFFRLMPVSVGAVFLEADSEDIKARNRDREKVASTAHENRSHMVDLMQPSIEFAKEVLNARNVPTRIIRTTGDIGEARSELVDFASGKPCDAAPLRHWDKAPLLSAPPVWW